MTRHFHESLAALKRELITMSRLVQYMMDHAVEALEKRDPAFTRPVFEKERFINKLEIKIDDEGHGLFALAQPVAADMRVLTTILKVNTDLERIADHTINIAERTLKILSETPQAQTPSLNHLGMLVKKILDHSIEALIQEDVALAELLLAMDDEIDQENDSLQQQIEQFMAESAAHISSGMQLARISHELERIGDLANNIAESVVYMKKGKEVRHHSGLENLL